MEDLELRQNFLSVSKKIARDSFGVYYKVGELVGHEGAEDTAIIESFSVDEESEELKVHTSRGHCHLDFLVKLKEDYSNRSCSTCNLGQSGLCELELDHECISNTGNENHKDYWITTKEDG